MANTVIDAGPGLRMSRADYRRWAAAQPRGRFERIDGLVVVVEVLSPSTHSVDPSRKLVAYFRGPSVKHYLIFWPDQPQVIHHRRRDEDEGIDTRVLTAGEIRLDPPGVSIAIEEVYAG